MSVASNSNVLEKANVLSLFGGLETEMSDPLKDLIQEGNRPDQEVDLELDESPVTERKRVLVSQNQFPDQSLHILEQQLAELKMNLGRLKFYLGDLDDLLPR
jgi:hypothetical protein